MRHSVFNGVVDIHSHILPGVDDGPKSWDDAVELCRLSAADGVTHQVVTPHCNDRFQYDRPHLLSLVSQLQQLAGPELKILLGCDFHFSYDNLQRVLADPAGYAIEGTRYLLVELSDYGIPPQITDSFLKLGDCGITAIITHPERNRILHENLHWVLDWAAQGLVVQVTANSLTGFWGERSRRAAEWLLRHDAVHILASDCHDTARRVPGLSAARDAAAAICGAETADTLVNGNPMAVIRNQSLPYFPSPAVGPRERLA